MLKYVRIVHKSLCIFLSTSVVEDPWLSFPQLGWALGWDLQGSVVLMYNELTTPPDPSTKPQWLLRNPSVLYKYGCEEGLVAH
jgi:hypothetical protein